MAASKGHTETVKVLLESGAKVNEKNKDGITSLMVAASKGHADIVQVLITNGAKVNEKNRDGITSLMVAALNGHTETVKALLEAGADADVRCDCARFVSSFANLTGMPF